MSPEPAKQFYHEFLESLRKNYKPDLIKGYFYILHSMFINTVFLSTLFADGIFGEMMQVNIVNDGPVTLQLDSRGEK